MCHVIVDLDRGEDMQRREGELPGADGRSGVGQDGSTGQCAHVGGLAGHVGPGDDPGLGLKGCVVRDGRVLGDEQGGKAGCLDVRGAVQDLREAAGLAGVADDGQGQQYLNLGPDIDPFAQVLSGAILPAAELDAAVQVPEQQGVGHDEEEDISALADAVCECRQRMQALGRLTGLQALLQSLQGSAGEVSLFQAGK